MHVRIDQTRCHEGTARIDQGAGVAAGGRFMDTCDHFANDADIGKPDFAGDHINDLTANNQDIKRRIAACRGNRAAAQGVIIKIKRF